MPNPATAPTTTQMVLARLDAIEANLTRLSKFAAFLATPMAPGEPNFLENMSNLMEMLVAGTEETHKSLQDVHRRLQEPGIARAIERAVKDV